MVARQNVARSVQRADYVIHPDVDGYSPFDFSAAGELIELGYRHTLTHMEDIKREWRRKSGWLGRLRTRKTNRNVGGWKPDPTDPAVYRGSSEA